MMIPGIGGAGAPMPGMPPMGGPAGAPPGLSGGTGPAAAPSPMKPVGLSGMAAVKAGLELLQKALGDLPLGSDVHASVLKAVSEISKHASDTGANPTPQDIIQQLTAAAKMAQMDNGMAPKFPGAPAAPPGGGAPPPPMNPPM